MQAMQITDLDYLTIRTWAKEHKVIEKVWLYGSRARGDNRPDSDIDLAIQTEGCTSDDSLVSFIFAKHELQSTISALIILAVDLEWYHPKEKMDRVGPGVKKDGILLYQRC